MHTNRKDPSKLCFRIKLLSGNNVVLVEADGLDSEIFVPRVHDGRIDFQNIIPSRRVLEDTTNQRLQQKHYSTYTKPKLPTTAPVPTRCPEVFISEFRTQKLRQMYALRKGITPVAPPNSSIGSGDVFTSTPKVYRLASGTENIENQSPHLKSVPKKKIPPVTIRYPDERNPSSQSPQAARSHPPCAASPQNLDVLEKPQKVAAPAQQVTNKRQPGQIIKDVSNCSSELMQNAGNLHSERFSMNLPRTPNLKVASQGSTPNPKVASPASTPNPKVASQGSTPNPKVASQGNTCNQPGQIAQQQKNLHSKSSFVTKWRKCITPMRTYSRRNSNVLQQRSSRTNRTAKKSKGVPTYMAKSTQGPKGTHKLIVQKRKLIIDPKVSISPPSFKKQQQESSNVSLKQTLGRTQLREAIQRAKQSPAFDMLTHSNHSGSLASALNEQFRKACVNKISSTSPKYQLLCSLPPSRDDAEARALRRKVHSAISNNLQREGYVDRSQVQKS